VAFLYQERSNGLKFSKYKHDRFNADHGISIKLKSFTEALTQDIKLRRHFGSK